VVVSKGDTTINYDDLKSFLQRFISSAAARVTQLLQLAKQALGDQRPYDALIEMKALCHHLTAIAVFNCSIQHLPCRKNPVTVALSRVSIDAVHLGLNCNQLAKGSNRTPRYQLAPPSVVTFSASSTACSSLLISDSTPSEAEICLAKDWVRYCTACQTSKIQLHTEMGPRSFHQPKRRFTHIHVDIMGPLPLSEGHRYLFTIVGRPTRWPEAIPICPTPVPPAHRSALWVDFEIQHPYPITSDQARFSLHSSGCPWGSYWAPPSITQRPTTRKLTAWWRVSIEP
ncbi:uncharacterized protein LOC119572076, partial [Penaeus monodon]|uniref:uncharacterized protein LOC119572076 n=1 Tax=Penaeus monodon TaxID=6687 RepID=UPI0018A6DEDB